MKLIKSGSVVFIMCLFLGMFSAPSFGELPLAALPSPWQQTSLELNDLKYLLTTKNCMSSPEHFTGCIASLNLILKKTTGTTLQSKTPDQIEKSTATPSAMTSQLHENLIHHFNTAFLNVPLELVVLNKTITKLTPKNSALLSSLDQARAYQNKIKAEHEQYKALNTSFINKKNLWMDTLRFEELWQWVYKLQPNLFVEKINIAQSINQYLKFAYEPHTMIVPKLTETQERERNGEEKVELGIQAGIENNNLIITQVLEESAAFKAGIKANDLILSVNGQTEKSPEMRLKYLFDYCINANFQSQPTVPLHITVYRDKKYIDIHLELKRKFYPNVSVKLIKNEDNQNLAHLKIESFFHDSTCREVRQLLENEKVDGLILDLRNNTGGLLEQACCVAQLFVPNQNMSRRTIFSGIEINKNFKLKFKCQTLNTRKTHDSLETIPMITLINSSTASASEVLAGSLQELKRSLIFGSRSFGKAAIQEILHSSSPNDITLKKLLENSTIYFRKTVATLFLPSGKSYHRKGIDPDLECYGSHQNAELEKLAIHEDDQYLTENKINKLNIESSVNNFENQTHLISTPISPFAPCIPSRQEAAAALESKSLDPIKFLALSALKCLLFLEKNE